MLGKGGTKGQRDEGTKGRKDGGTKRQMNKVTKGQRDEGLKGWKRRNNMDRVQKVRTFRDLIAWQQGMDLSRAVYPIIKRMPPSEKFELANQMWRAAYSVPSNIAEGYARQSRPDYLKFLRIARG